MDLTNIQPAQCTSNRPDGHAICLTGPQWVKSMQWARSRARNHPIALSTPCWKMANSTEGLPEQISEEQPYRTWSRARRYAVQASKTPLSGLPVLSLPTRHQSTIWSEIARRRRQSYRMTARRRPRILSWAYECRIQQASHRAGLASIRALWIIWPLPPGEGSQSELYRSYGCTSNGSRSYKPSYGWGMPHTTSFAWSRVQTPTPLRRLLSTSFCPCLADSSANSFLAERLDLYVIVLVSSKGVQTQK